MSCTFLVDYSTAIVNQLGNKVKETFRSFSLSISWNVCISMQQNLLK